MALDLSQHPCFNADSRHKTGRMHLPVAPKCNIQCNYCDRKYDCANESRPGVTSTVLTPQQGLVFVEKALAKMPQLKVVGIAGPGDPFANPAETMETLRLVRDKYPEMLLCVATNGLNAEPYAEEMAQLQVSHVTFTVNAVDPAVGEKVYAWVRDGRQIFRGRAAAEHLWERQRAAIIAYKQRGVTVKINTIIVPGVNDHHVEAVAAAMRDLGADIMNCIPLYPVADTPFEVCGPVDPEALKNLRANVGKMLPQMSHCARCRADAVGLLGADNNEMTVLMSAVASNAFAAEHKPYVAVASLEGLLVNQHLGHATKFWIYRQGAKEPEFVEMRYAPEAGGGMERWQELGKTLSDCRAVFVNACGRAPRWALEQTGLKVIEMSGFINEGVNSFYHSGEVPLAMRKQYQSCGSGCSGNGMGCS